MGKSVVWAVIFYLRFFFFTFERERPQSLSIVIYYYYILWCASPFLAAESNKLAIIVRATILKRPSAVKVNNLALKFHIYARTKFIFYTQSRVCFTQYNIFCKFCVFATPLKFNLTARVQIISTRDCARRNWWWENRFTVSILMKKKTYFSNSQKFNENYIFTWHFYFLSRSIYFSCVITYNYPRVKRPRRILYIHLCAMSATNAQHNNTEEGYTHIYEVAI